MTVAEVQSAADAAHFLRGVRDVRQFVGLADGCTTAEVRACGGPDFTDGSIGAEPLAWHYGLDWAILAARRGDLTSIPDAAEIAAFLKGVTAG